MNVDLDGAARGLDDVQVEMIEGDGARAVLPDVGRLRVAVWRHEHADLAHAFASDVWLDEHDEHACHLLVRRQGMLVAAARVCAHANADEIEPGLDPTNLHAPIAWIARMVVAPAVRGRGLSSMLDEQRAAWAAARGCKTMVACWSSYSRAERWPALERDGFLPLTSTGIQAPFTPTERTEWLWKPL